MRLFERWRLRSPDLGSPAAQERTQEAERLIDQGNVREDAGDLDQALSLYNDAIECAPSMARGYLNRGNILLKRGDSVSAASAYREATARQPDHAGAHFNLGNALVASGQLDQALAEFRRALMLKPDFADAELALGNAYEDLGRLDDAIDSCERAVRLRPDSTDALTNLGLALTRAKRYADAAVSFQKVVELQPRRPYARGNLLAARLYACDWRSCPGEPDAIHHAVARGERVISPFHFVAVARSAAAQHQCSRIYSEDKHPPRPPIWRGETYTHQRIRVAYLSADYHSHATALLMAGLFELHDRSRFEIYAISFGRDDHSPTRARLLQAFEHFIDVRTKTDRQVADLLRTLEIDIAVDLKGYTASARPGVLAWRPAPVQVSFLGFPGTLGARYIDYIVADRCVIPDASCVDYEEQVIRLPDCYQVNDAKRYVPRTCPDRESAGLPASAFVFCSFNNNFKITPEVFSLWMRILKACPHSILWLLRDNDDAVRNLLRETELAGVDATRVVFASRLDMEAHLERHQLADLFLDTTPCNAHTTASDALWCGLPVLTCRGETFAGRVAESLLRAVGLDEMVVESMTDYERMAVELYHDAARLATIKHALGKQNCRHPLFNTERFARKLEAAYSTISARAANHLPAAALDVSGN